MISGFYQQLFHEVSIMRTSLPLIRTFDYYHPYCSILPADSPSKKKGRSLSPLGEMNFGPSYANYVL